MRRTDSHRDRGNCRQRHIQSGRSALAVDATTGMYLIVWEEETTPGNYDVLGRLMAADGSLPGGTIAVSTWTNDQLRPDVAFNTAAGNFLVVWEDHHWGTGADPDIYGQRVAGNGGLLGGNIGISWDSPNDRLNPAVTYLSATRDSWWCGSTSTRAVITTCTAAEWGRRPACRGRKGCLRAGSQRTRPAPRGERGSELFDGLGG